jgi:hypothetical protein
MLKRREIPTVERAVRSCIRIDAPTPSFLDHVEITSINAERE